MHILFLDQFSQPGGAQQCLRDLFPALTARGWSWTLVDNLEIGPFHHGRKSFHDALRFARQIPAARRAIGKLPGDLVYVNGPRLLPALPGGRPVVFHCHNYLGRRYAAWLARTAIRRTQATVIGACRFVLEPLRIPGAQVVYNGVRESAPRVAGDTFRIGMIGRIAPQKGQAEFLRAARHLSGCRFVICGAPLFGEARYEAEIRRLSEGLPVEFLGWQDNPGEVLARLDLLVVPSTVPEATPRIILEAFSGGVPVLASASGGIPELIEHNRTGFLIESLAAQMRALAADPELLSRVAANARAEWRARFTLEKYQGSILRILESAAPTNLQPPTSDPPRLTV
jgi:glycosyltransferase involved in cell wall biosynthesis